MAIQNRSQTWLNFIQRWEFLKSGHQKPKMIQIKMNQNPTMKKLIFGGLDAHFTVFSPTKYLLSLQRITMRRNSGLSSCTATRLKVAISDPTL